MSTRSVTPSTTTSPRPRVRETTTTTTTTLLVIRRQLGPKISQNFNYTRRGTMEGPKTLSEARRREAPECRGGRVWEGRRSPSPVCGSGGIAPRKFWNLTVQICSFFPRFQGRDSSSIRCFSFIYCYLVIIDHLVFRKVNTVKQNSESWLKCQSFRVILSQRHLYYGTQGYCANSLSTPSEISHCI